MDLNMIKNLIKKQSIIFTFDILYYDKKALLRTLIGNRFVSWMVSNYLNKDKRELTCNEKKFCINVCEKVSKELNKLIKEKTVPGILSKDIRITRILYIKEEQGMKLQIEINEIDINNMLDVLINAAQEGNKDESGKSGKEGSDQNKELIFTLLKNINNDVSADEKIKLIQLILGWVNSNRLVQKALDTLIAGNEDIRAKLEPAKINIGDISILTD